MLDLLNANDRKTFIQMVKQQENIDRKNKSFKEYEVLNDRLKKYVKEYLLEQFSSQTVLDMPLVSSVNLLKRVCNKQATIYKESPEREYSNLQDGQEEELEKLYEALQVDSYLMKSNLFFKAQQQSFLQVIPKGNKLNLKVILPHQLDVIPDPENPNEAIAYVMNTFDRQQVLDSNHENEQIADQDDYMSQMARYIAWTKDWNFVFDGSGNIVGEILPNPLGDLSMFIDVSSCKDSEFFVRSGDSLLDFTIQYNGALSDLGNVLKMQGYSIAYLIAEQSLIPSQLRVGPNLLLKLPVNPDAPNAIRPEFGFASPNADIAGGIQYIETLLSNFLSSMGLSPKLVSGKGESEKFTSGLDRLLSMLDQFETSKQDYIIYENVEMKIYELIKRWSALQGTDKFLSFVIPENSEISIKYARPEMVQSEQEKLAIIEKKLELGLMSEIEAIEMDRNVDSEKAQEIYAEINIENKQYPEQNVPRGTVQDQNVQQVMPEGT